MVGCAESRAKRRRSRASTDLSNHLPLAFANPRSRTRAPSSQVARRSAASSAVESRSSLVGGGGGRDSDVSSTGRAALAGSRRATSAAGSRVSSRRSSRRPTLGGLAGSTDSPPSSLLDASGGGGAGGGGGGGGLLPLRAAVLASASGSPTHSHRSRRGSRDVPHFAGSAGMRSRAMTRDSTYARRSTGGASYASSVGGGGGGPGLSPLAASAPSPSPRHHHSRSRSNSRSNTFDGRATPFARRSIRDVLGAAAGGADSRYFAPLPAGAEW